MDDFEPDLESDSKEATAGDIYNDGKDIYDDGKSIYNDVKERKAEKAAKNTSNNSSGQAGAKGTGNQATQGATNKGAQGAKEAGKQATKETGKQATKETGKQVAKEAGKEVAKQAGKEGAKVAAKAGLSAAAGAATGGISLAVEAAYEGAKVVGKRIKKGLDNLGVDTEEGKKNAKRFAGLGCLGTTLFFPILIIILIMVFISLANEDSKTYEVSEYSQAFVKCAESDTGCKDFWSTKYEIEPIGKRLIEMENGDWNPFVPDEVTELTNSYIKFVRKYSIDDDAVTYDPLILGDDITSEMGIDPGDEFTKTEQQKKVYNFKSKTMKTYFLLSATAFNNVSWILAGPNDKSEETKVELWDDETNLKEYGNVVNFKEFLDKDKGLAEIIADIKSKVNPIYGYKIDQRDFGEIKTKMDESNVTEKTYTENGVLKSQKIHTGLRVPEEEHIGISEDQYLQMLEPILPAWIEPFMIYSASGDWNLAKNLYEFYGEALDDNPYKVGLYPVPTITTRYIYNSRTYVTDEIIGYEQKYDEATGTYIDDTSRPIYRTIKYYGKLPAGVIPVDGNTYSIDNPDDTKIDILCTYTAVLLKGYTYEYNIDTKWTIEFGGSTKTEPVPNGSQSVATQVDNYYIKSDGTEDTPYKYKYTNSAGVEVEKEVKNRLEWYIMTHYYESRGLADSIQDEIDNATTDDERNAATAKKKIFKYIGLCKDGTTDGCDSREKIKLFDYTIDSLAVAIQRCNEYYEKVKKEVGYTTSVTGRAPTEGYLSYSALGTLENGQFVWPVPESKNITACYGHYEDGGSHGGVDIGNAGIGQPGVSGPNVVAAAGGTVIKTQTGQSHNPGSGGLASYGNFVKIDHGGGWTTIYAHLSSVSVSVGDVVKTGDLIGVMGNTGNSDGVHLHFETQLNGVRQNPTSGLLLGIPEGAADSKWCRDSVVYAPIPAPDASVDAGTGVGNDSYRAANAYRATAEKWAAYYGVDPDLVIAIIAQESGGNPRANGAAVGLMQWEKSNGTSLTTTKANGTSETITGITESQLLASTDFQIRVGCAEFKNKLNYVNGNTYMALQSYNYGTCGMQRVVSYTVSGSKGAAGCSDLRISDYKAYAATGDTKWMNNRGIYQDIYGSSKGDAKYVEHVLQYYNPT